MKKSWQLGRLKIITHEILTNITIIAVMMIPGFVFSGKIERNQMDKNAEYYKVTKITETEMFQYRMNTNIGNAFVYGDSEAVDTVTFPEIGGEYLYVKKVEEHYSMHTRMVTYTDPNGKTQTWTETYWGWDYAGSEEAHSHKVRSCSIEMDYPKVAMPGTDYIDTISESGFVRSKYYGCNPKYTGTVYTDLQDGAMKDDSPFYVGQDIEPTVEYSTSGLPMMLSRIIRTILTGGAVAGPICLDNEWLED